MVVLAASLALGSLLLPVHGASPCSKTLTPGNGVKPSIASGYQVQLIATGLADPRGIQFDTAGNLLVVEQGRGAISAYTFTDHGGTCLELTGNTTVVDTHQLNHGIELSSDGKTLYASSSDEAYSWSYDAKSKQASKMTTLVTGMTNDDHTTRTLLLSQKVPGMLLISRGSTENLDLEAADITSGHSQIKAFNLNNITSKPYDYDTDGLRLGWGLRNSVGVAEHPDTGGIYSVENSVDEMTRDGKDIHQDNPGEEMNFHGYLNGTKDPEQGDNFGYPWCYAAWVVSDIPANGSLAVGKQFAIDPINGQSRNDTYCAAQVAPRLTFQAHMAPLDIKFNNSGTEGWVTFHGSWDRDDPVGYKLSVIEFQNGEPVEPSTSMTAEKDIFMNADNSACPDHCMRPVGIAFDNQGRLFMSSDSTGELYVIMKETSSSSSSSASGSPSGTSSGAKPTQSSGDIKRVAWLELVMAFALALTLHFV